MATMSMLVTLKKMTGKVGFMGSILTTKANHTTTNSYWAEQLGTARAGKLLGKLGLVVKSTLKGNAGK